MKKLPKLKDYQKKWIITVGDILGEILIVTIAAIIPYVLHEYHEIDYMLAIRLVTLGGACSSFAWRFMELFFKHYKRDNDDDTKAS